MKRWTTRPEGSNWGEFGDEDQIGMMNTLTPKMRQAALAEAKEGIAFCLSLPLDYPGGSELVGFRTPPKLIAPIRTTGEVSFNYPASTHHLRRIRRTVFSILDPLGRPCPLGPGIRCRR